MEDCGVAHRRRTVAVKIGEVTVGNGAPISVQSMTNTDTRDAGSTLRQIRRLAKAGCDIVRVAVPDMDAAESLKEIITRSPIPVVADIHFNYRLAIRSIEHGVHGLRINPGNIGSKDRVVKVVKAAKAREVPIRIGVNAGSLERDLRKEVDDGSTTLPQAMVESAKRHIAILENLDFRFIKISLKSSDVLNTIAAYRLMAKECRYPFHIGITEAGTTFSGIIKSAVGMGVLLNKGIGDTIRVSLTADPVEEVRAGIRILRALGLRKGGVEVISCPTCGRTEIDVEKIARAVEKELDGSNLNIKVAVMGCAVNGPGEAKHADVGIAGGKDAGALFRKGRIVRKVQKADLAKALLEEAAKIGKE